MTNGLVEELRKYFTEVTQVLETCSCADIAKVVSVLEKARSDGRWVYVFGNGGSASTASHFASDLNKGATRMDKPRFKAFCLNDNMPVLTAWANDTHYGMVFAEQLNNFVEKGDVVIAISGSGNSPNVLNAVRLGKDRGAYTIGLTGFDGGGLKGLVDLPIVVPCRVMQMVEDVHLVMEHVITKVLKEM